ncbi:bifunctional riboflavin kinase/FAD synthetase [Chrysiogenes arsenatis]|uniref:bifunctional riboflavin kinase/FAD synthetase n=1 Tax=Chrysiogenes arsenatis TaxID=309797 RepID=UPI00041E0C7B|nr:bifunctional riboflavin kinase/FAD synthetase [Chrysiogenes arsenatis]
MQIFYSIHEVTTDFPAPVLTIGNFDGVHVGHQKIFQALTRSADEIGGTSLCLTFEPHPLKVLRPEGIRLLIPREEKIRAIAASGIDVLIIQSFNALFASLTPDDFLRLLVDRLRVTKIIVGYDYAFGKDRQGDIAYFEAQQQAGRFAFEVVPPHVEDGKVVSSSRIRALVAEGLVDLVPRCMGRLYSLFGQVVHGDGRGRGIGFPTANLSCSHELLPKNGVYATLSKIGNKFFPSVTNIGQKPTFSQGTHVSIETHILDFDQDIYTLDMEVQFALRIRDEIKFSSADELITQIQADMVRVRLFFSDWERAVNGFEAYNAARAIAPAAAKDEGR